MMDFLDCKICHVPYDEDEHRPRHAPCGHEWCSACIKALIKESIFECPKCRQKNKVDVPEDLPVSFGLIDVIRAFKTQSISLPKEIEPKVSGASNEEVCKVHGRTIKHHCLNCNRWICEDCLEYHSSHTGCTTISSSTAVENMKTEHTKGIDKLVTNFEDDAKYLSSKIQNHHDMIQEITAKKKEILERAEEQRKELSKQAEEYGEEIKKIHNLLEKGTHLKENVVKSKDQLSSANSPHSVMNRIEVLDEMKQSLRSWSVKNLGIDTPHDLSKALKEGNDVNAEMVFNGQKRYGKFSQIKENMYFHTFREHKLPGSSMHASFDRLQKLFPMEASNVFLELSLEGTVKGHVVLHLDNNLPNIREYIQQMFTGQKDPIMSGLKLNYKDSYCIGTTDLPFKNMRVNPESSASLNSKRGDLVCCFNNGYLQRLNFQVAHINLFSYKVIGCVVVGMDIIQECYDNHSQGVVISDCGLINELD